MVKNKNKNNNNQDKDKKIEKALKQIKSKFGEEAVVKMKETGSRSVNTISTGCLSLDIALGIGGIPRGRVVEIFGPESSGKTTLALHVLAEAQKKGGVAAFIDAEHAIDFDYAKKIGLDVEDLIVSQPSSGEEALDIVESLVQSGTVDVVAIDSVAALTPEAEIKGEMGDQQIGLQARLMSRALRKLSSSVSDTNTAVVFLNQTRMKVGVHFGNPVTTPGGKALKFWSSVRINLHRRAVIKRDSDIVGNKVLAKIVKNKVASPFKKAEFNIYYDQGISKEADLINTGVEKGVIEQSGSWYNYGEEKLGQGLFNAKEYLRENPSLAEEIEEKIVEEIQKTSYGRRRRR